MNSSIQSIEHCHFFTELPCVRIGVKGMDVGVWKSDAQTNSVVALGAADVHDGGVLVRQQVFQNRV